MTALRFRGPVLPDGEARDAVRRRRPGHLRAAAGAETAAEGWIVPGPGRRPLPPRARRRRRDRRRGDRGAGDRRPRRRRAADPRLRLGRRHRVDPRPRGPAAADPGRPAHRPHQALHPQLRPRGRARRAGRRTSPRRPSAATAGSSSSATGSPATRATWRRRSRAEAFAAAIATAHEHGARVTAHCFGEAVLPRPDRGRHRLHRARHRAVPGPDRRDGREADRAGADGDADRQVPASTPRRRGDEVPGVRRAHDRPARPAARHDHGGVRGRRAALRRHRRRRDQPARQHRRRGGRDGGPGHARGRTRSAPPRGGPGSGSAGTPASTRARPADFVVYDRDPREDLVRAGRADAASCSAAGVV